MENEGLVLSKAKRKDNPKYIFVSTYLESCIAARAEFDYS